MLFQVGAAIVAVSLVRRTRFNISWILISAGLILMAVRRLFDFSTLFWESPLFVKDTVNPSLGVVISVLVFVGVVFIRKIFTLQRQIDELKVESENRVLNEVLSAEERTRQRFARELHDGMGPLLASVKMSLSAVSTDELPEYSKQLVVRSLRNTETAIGELKEISNLLSPHLLVNYGLEAALKNLERQLFEGKLTCFFESEIGDKRYSGNIEINCYRIVSELMTNTLVHSGAQLATLKMREANTCLLIEYSDDGRGFDPALLADLAVLKGMGLNNLESRVKSLNGDVQMTTMAGQGFLAEIQIPLS